VDEEETVSEFERNTEGRITHMDGMNARQHEHAEEKAEEYELLKDVAYEKVVLAIENKAQDDFLQLLCFVNTLVDDHAEESSVQAAKEWYEKWKKELIDEVVMDTTDGDGDDEVEKVVRETLKEYTEVIHHKH
jgi:hypothetical protein